MKRQAIDGGSHRSWMMSPRRLRLFSRSGLRGSLRRGGLTAVSRFKDLASRVARRAASRSSVASQSRWYSSSVMLLLPYSREMSLRSCGRSAGLAVSMLQRMWSVSIVWRLCVVAHLADFPAVQDFWS